jgi:hypothetical protein
MVTGLVHWFLLRPLLHRHGDDLVADELLHVVVPILAVVGWLVSGPRPAMSWWARLRANDVAAGLARRDPRTGRRDRLYPYPFVDPRSHGWDHVVVVSAGVFVLWFALLLGQQAYDRRMSRAPRVATAITGS